MKRRHQVRRGPVQRVEGTVYREFERAAVEVIDEEKRIVEISFSSPEPVRRMDFFDDWIEVLGHEEDEADFSRLNGSAPLLYNHMRSREDRIGGVQSGEIVDGRGVARVQFSARDSVDDVWQDVLAGILRTVSVGYIIHKRELVRDDEDGEPPTYRVTSWEVLEISFVDIPADPTVGVGRQSEEQPGELYRVIDLNPSREGKTMAKKRKQAKQKRQIQKRGEELGSELEKLIGELVDDDMSREDVITELAEAADMAEEDVEEMVGGADVCPTMEQLEAFAEVLSVEVDALVSAAEADGCEFEAADDDDDGGDDGGDTDDDSAQNEGDDEGRSGGSGRTNRRKSVMKKKQQRKAAGGGDETRATLQEIRSAIAPHRERLGTEYDAILDAAIDGDIRSVDAARERALDHLGQKAKPVGGERVVAGEGESEKFLRGAGNALMIRGGIAKADGPERKEGAGEFRGASLIDLARICLERRGTQTMGLHKMDMIGRAFTSTSDFPKLLENVQEKALLQGYEEANETWQIWTQRGSLPDFKEARRAGLSSFPDLKEVGEGGEYKYGTFGEHGETISLATYGRILSITRQTIINDDLQALTQAPNRMGRAASRMVGNIVYGILTGNPNMSDGTALFHADHNNLQSGAALSVDTVSEMRTAMALQKDVDENAAGLNIPFGFLIVPKALEDKGRQILTAQYDPRTSVNQQIPNPVAGAGELVSDPRLDADSSTAHYGVAAQGFDTVEVAFLDGVETPFMEAKDGWSTDGTEWKVRLDVGASPLDFRTVQKNPGA